MKKLKVMTIVGTRPELIRLSLIIKAIDRVYSHIFVHTGQNFDHHLHQQFFQDLELRNPDYQFNIDKKQVGVPFIAEMLINIENIIEKESPDCVLILGDTNSCLSAYVFKQKGIPVFHMEAGNRCFDYSVPEELNRRIVDSCSDYLLTYTQRSREQLLLEGYHPSKVIVTGNPIVEVIQYYLGKKSRSAVLKELSLKEQSFVLVTLHRTENLAQKNRLSQIIAAINAISEKYPVLISMHPRLSDRLGAFDLKLSDKILTAKPFSFTEFLQLLKNAKLVLSDSGTVPEEANVLGIPCVLVRDSTERPELLENNSMVVSGVSRDGILNGFEVAMGSCIGEVPMDYLKNQVADTIVKILMLTYKNRT